MDVPTALTNIRPADPDDAATIARLVRELAEFERAADAVRADESHFRRALAGRDPIAAALVAEIDGEAVGFALWYRTFSTWDGEPGMHLEDLFVTERSRGSGVGRALFVALARIAVERGFTRLEWDVLRWNTSAIRFYESLDATAQDEWLAYRLDEQGIRTLAGA